MSPTKNKQRLLKEAQNYCDDNDKSTEFMIQYMQDYANSTHDEVTEFLMEQTKSSKPQAGS